jgi:hypothetical protein
VPIQVHWSCLALFPTPIQLCFGPVDVLPIICWLDRGYSQACARLNRSAGRVCRRLLPEEGFAPNVLVFNHAVPVGADPAGRDQGGSIELCEDLNGKFHRQPRDEVKLDDGGIIAAQRITYVHIGVDVVTWDICLHLGTSHGDADTAFVVVQRVVRKPSWAGHGDVHEIVAMQPIARDSSCVSRRGACISWDNRRLLAGPRHGERWGFDGAEVVSERAVAVSRVQQSRMSVEAGSLSEPVPGGVRGCGTGCTLGMARKLGPRRLAVVAKSRRCWD